MLSSHRTFFFLSEYYSRGLVREDGDEWSREEGVGEQGSTGAVLNPEISLEREVGRKRKVGP